MDWTCVGSRARMRRRRMVPACINPPQSSPRFQPGVSMMSESRRLAFRVITSAGAIAVCAFCTCTASAAEPKAWVEKNLDDLQALYKQLHASPELSFQEEKTAARLAEEFRKLGLEVATGVGRHGVVG